MAVRIKSKLPVLDNALLFEFRAHPSVSVVRNYEFNYENKNFRITSPTRKVKEIQNGRSMEEVHFEAKEIF